MKRLAAAVAAAFSRLAAQRGRSGGVRGGHRRERAVEG
jgi:hypothetical protein